MGFAKDSFRPYWVQLTKFQVIFALFVCNVFNEREVRKSTKVKSGESVHIASHSNARM